MNPIDDATLVSAARKVWPPARAVYLYGSRAKGEARPSSDYDLAVLGLPKAEFDPILAVDLARILDCVVDFVELRWAPTILQKEILEGGRLLWAEDPFEVGMFESFVFASYQKLCEERADIIAAGVASGRFYQP